jgi:3-methylcrotonyl-CoA carboxylase alpha subunit
MPGRVVLIKVAPGDAGRRRPGVGVMEAMKMELALKAPRAGRVAGVQVKAGDFVEADAC